MLLRSHSEESNLLNVMDRYKFVGSAVFSKILIMLEVFIEKMLIGLNLQHCLTKNEISYPYLVELET